MIKDSDSRRDDDAVGLSGAIDGFLGGIGFIVFTPSIWGWALVPAVILVFLVCGSGALGVWGTDELLRWIFGAERGTWSSVGYWALFAVMFVLVLLVSTVLGLVLAQPLSGYALEKIAHAQERKLTGRAGPSHPFFASLLLNLRTVAFALLVGGTALVALFLITLFFPPASVVTLPLKFLVCSWMLAWDFLDYPLGLRGLGIRARLAWVARHFGAFTLFGVLWAGLCVVPGIVLMILPMGVAGATRMVLRDDPRHRMSG